MSLLENLCIRTGLVERDVRQIMISAPVRYKTYFVAKKSGGKRMISQPAREVKLVQSGLADILLDHLPMHQAAMAYRFGKSIHSNASAHAHSSVILKMDFKDFFPSIKSQDWIDYCRKTECLGSEEDIFLTSRLLFRKYPGQSRLGLAIGAPSSPSLSNALMYEFDTLITDALSSENVTYTRYADDLTFSAPRTGYLTTVAKAVRQTIKTISYPTLSINEQKTVYATKKYSRRVTGLTLANDGRVTIGRRTKRTTIAAVHHALLGKLSKEQLRSLSGYLAHINAVEPEFLHALSREYGHDNMQRLFNLLSEARVIQKDQN